MAAAAEAQAGGPGPIGAAPAVRRERMIHRFASIGPRDPGWCGDAERSEGEHPDGVAALAAAALGWGAAGDALDAFLGADDPATLLRLWFGEGAEALRRDPDALRSACDRAVADLDDLLGEQVEAVMHHPAFRGLEASWRGLALLLDAAGDDERVRVRLLAASWDEIARDLDRAAEFDRSALFDRVYGDGFGTPGGLPYGLLVCDVEARHRRRAGDPFRFDDVSTLSALSSVAAAAFAPCVVGAGADLFGVDDVSRLAALRDLGRAFAGREHERWRAFQARPDSRFLVAACPRVLLRPPRPDDGARREPFRFREGRGGLPASDWLWGNAAYAVAANVVRCFRETGWFADIEGTRQDADGFGLVAGLPAPPASTGEDIAARRPLEVELTDGRARTLEEAGLAVLGACRLGPEVAVLSAPSVHRPAAEDGPDGRLAATLRHTLCVSRFAHYLKVIARDVLGALTSAAELEARLNAWVRRYTIANPDASEDLKARFPLAGARIAVTEAPGRPDGFACTVQLKPHFEGGAPAAAPALRTELHGPSR